ncbi:MAG TPA: hypothetical protein VKA08_19560 [Balneolales bacterium]|nr:hypothetical protein [Balneolales bacterium]
MKSLTFICIIFCAVIIYSCNSNPVSNRPIPAHGSQSISLKGYGAKLDSTYFKVWSDSSWESFDMDTTMSGTTYAVLIDNTGYEYFYGPKGYSGFWPYGGNLVMFDSVLADPPDSMTEGKTYTEQTTFTSQGINYVIKVEASPIDTATVTVPFGTFKNCIWIQSTTSISGAGQTNTSSTQYWYAKGPSDIEKQYSTGINIMMAYGSVNGQVWGGASNKAAPEIMYKRKMTASHQSSNNSLHTLSGNDINSMAPMILKGVNVR